MHNLENPQNISFTGIRHALCILQPVRIHPALEKLIGGKPIHELNFFSLSRFQQILLLKSRKHLLAANPRSAMYMLTTAHNFLEDKAPSASIDLLIDSEFEKELPDFIKKWPQNIWVGNKIPDALHTEIRNKKYDGIFLLYTDAIGQGWRKIEGQLSPAVSDKKVWVINGRRRIFLFNNDARFTLGLRRFLDISCIVEILLFLGIITVAIITAAYDLFTHGKSKIREESP